MTLDSGLLFWGHPVHYWHRSVYSWKQRQWSDVRFNRTHVFRFNVFSRI